MSDRRQDRDVRTWLAACMSEQLAVSLETDDWREWRCRVHYYPDPNYVQAVGTGEGATPAEAIEAAFDDYMAVPVTEPE